MGRSRSCSSKSNHGVSRGAHWTALEDKILKDYIINNGAGRWDKIPKQTGLKRGGKSCRLRWMNYLRPDIIRGNISADEEDLIVRLHKLLGNRWSLIAGRLPGRTDNEIKNYWNTILSKKVEANNCDHSKRYSCRDLEDPIIKEPSNIDDDYPPPPSLLDENVGSSKNLIEPSIINNGFLEENDSSSWEEFMIDVNERQIITDDDSLDKLCCDRNNIATMIENEECYVGCRNWSTSSTSSFLEESFHVRNWTGDDHSFRFESDLYLW